MVSRILASGQKKFLAEFKLELFAVFPQIAERCDKRANLRQGGGNGRAVRLHAQHRDKEDVQSDIDESCHADKVERPLGFTHAAQYAAHGIIPEHKRVAKSCYNHVGPCLGQGLPRAVQRVKNWQGKNDRCKHQQGGNTQHKAEQCTNRLFCAPLIPGTDKLRNVKFARR